MPSWSGSALKKWGILFVVVGNSNCRQSLSELAARYEIHPSVITNWKKRAREGLGDVFAGKVEKRQRGSEAETKELYAKIGELTVEKDFLSKALDR